MKNRSRLILAILAATLVVLGAAVSLPPFRPDQRPVVLTGAATFPDYSEGHQPGMNAANQVGIRLTLATEGPWLQGQRDELSPTVEADPGPGVASVELTTLFLYLERPGSPNPAIVTGDLVLLAAAGVNRWASRDGPIIFYPNQDVTGDDFFLGFALSLNVDYRSGQSYGYGGWNPDVRIASPDIVPELAPLGLLLIATGLGCGMLVAIARVFDRHGVPIRL